MTIRTTFRAAMASFALGAAPALVLIAIPSGPALAQAGYQLQAGDVLQVEVLEDPSLNRSLLVLPDGSISFPQVGTLRAGGRSVDQVRAALTQGLAPNFASPPNVYVTVSSLAPPPAPGSVQAQEETVTLYVMGEVGVPGRKDVTPDTNLLQLLSQAGQFSRFAARGRIELHRLDPATRTARVYLFDLDQIGGAPNRISGLTTLAEGDVVVVPTRRLFE